MANHQKDKLLPIHIFAKQLVLSFLLGTVLVGLALGVGMLGYHAFQPMSWMDAFLNASMILSGMGPVTTLTTESGKFFAGCYALFSGLAFIAIMAVIFAPIVHRFLHKAHLDIKD